MSAKRPGSCGRLEDACLSKMIGGQTTIRLAAYLHVLVLEGTTDAIHLNV